MAAGSGVMLMTLSPLMNVPYSEYVDVLYPPTSATPGPHGWYQPLLPPSLASCIASTCPVECRHSHLISFSSSGGLEMFDQNHLAQFTPLNGLTVEREDGNCSSALESSSTKSSSQGETINLTASRFISSYLFCLSLSFYLTMHLFDSVWSMLILFGRFKERIKNFTQVETALRFSI